MATRPDFIPQFASLDVNLPETGNINKLRPPLEIRETGYDFLQKIPAEEFNWLMNNFAEWVQYLDELTRDQGITEIATREQAEQGVSINTLMTPQRTLQSIQYNAIPPGNVQYTARTTAPSGWLVCDGSAVSRVTYSRLFAAIGTTFGAGDGSTSFNIPDLRNEFIRGANPSGGRPVGASEGDALRSHSHTGTTSVAGQHTHSYSDSYHIESRNGPNNNFVVPRQQGSGDTDGDNTRIWYINRSTAAAGQHTHTFTTNATGGSETRPRNVALLPIIKT